MSGFINRGGSTSNRNPVTKFIKKLSSFGMKYDDLVMKNSRSIGITEDEFGWRYDQANLMGGEYDEYRMFANLSMADVNLRKNISIYDKNYEKKREDLRKFAVADKIEDVLDVLADEAIVYDPKQFFAYPKIFDYELVEDTVNKEIQDAISENYKKIYGYFGFNNDIAAWNFFRKWLIDGFLAFEIIYDVKMKNIIGFKEIDPVTLEPGLDGDGKKIWTQFKGQQNKERTLYDSQVIYLSYSQINSPGRVSYVERLIRTFNILRIMEHSRVIWAVVNSSFKTKFIIPVGGKSKTRAKQSLGVLMQSYREVMDFDMDSGELKVNGKPMMPFNKEYWLPSNDAGQPEIETVANEGPDLSDTDALRYFREEFHKVTKIPLSRFDQESPPSWEMGAEGTTRDEIKFGRFIDRMRTQFQEIIVKPLWQQMALDFPELAEDDNFRQQIGIEYHKNNMFIKMQEMEVLEKQINFIQTMKDGLVDTDAEMNDIKFFSSEFLVRKYLDLSTDDLKLNAKLKAKEDKKMKEDAAMAAKLEAEREGGGGGF